MDTTTAVREIKSLISRYKYPFPVPHSKSDYWKPYMTGMAQRTAPFLIHARRRVTFDSPPEMPILIFALDTTLFSDTSTLEALLEMFKKVAISFQSDTKPGAVILAFFDEVFHLPVVFWPKRSPFISPPPAQSRKSNTSVLLSGLDTVFVSEKNSGACLIFDPNSMAFRLPAKLLFEDDTALPKIEVEGKRFDSVFDYQGKTFQLEDFAWRCSGRCTTPLNIDQNRTALPFLIAVTNNSTARMDLGKSRLFSKARKSTVQLLWSGDSLEILAKSPQ